MFYHSLKKFKDNNEEFLNKIYRNHSMRCKLVKEYTGLNISMEIYEPVLITKGNSNINNYKYLNKKLK